MTNYVETKSIKTSKMTHPVKTYLNEDHLEPGLLLDESQNHVSINEEYIQFYSPITKSLSMKILLLFILATVNSLYNDFPLTFLVL